MTTDVKYEQDVPDLDVSNDRVALYTKITSIVIVAGATLFLLKTLHLGLILRNNTPTGGDMGAHVWGPAFLRDHLLSSWKLTGWSMDWYAGFPVYRFYMVVPAILILLVDLIVPYGVAIKIVAVIGILTLPFATWLFGRLARFAFPIPELLAIAATVFLYDESFTIYGGNIASTMAGEFSFSIALTLAMIGFGLFAHGMHTGERRILTAVVIALAALCHGVVLIFVFIGVALMLLLWRDELRLKWGLWVMGIAALLSSFWVIPFITGHAYMTDMKYEPRPSGANDSFWKMFFPLPAFWNISIMLFALVGFAVCIYRRQKVGIWLGIFGIVLAIFVFISRDGLPIIGLLWNPRVLPFFYLVRYMLMMIGIYEVVAGVARFVALEEMARSTMSRTEELVVVSAPSPIRSRPFFNIAMAGGMAVLVTFILAFHFQELPFGKVVTNSNNVAMYQWGPLKTKLSN
ncbi:MAG: 6-pyruvoyl-tetrahydropterin synthase-related protein, partial [Ilumatobacteraceae bacterium]